MHAKMKRTNPYQLSTPREQIPINQAHREVLLDRNCLIKLFFFHSKCQFAEKKKAEDQSEASREFIHPKDFHVTPHWLVKPCFSYLELCSCSWRGTCLPSLGYLLCSGKIELKVILPEEHCYICTPCLCCTCRDTGKCCHNFSHLRQSCKSLFPDTPVPALSAFLQTTYCKAIARKQSLLPYEPHMNLCLGQCYISLFEVKSKITKDSLFLLSIRCHIFNSYYS